MIVLAYLITLGISLLVIYYSYCFKHRANYFAMLEMISRDFIENQEVNDDNRDRVWFYDKSGKIVYTFGRDYFLLMKEDPAEMAKSYLPDIFRGMCVSKLIWWTPKIADKGISTSIVFYGVPVTVDREVTYACVYAKEIPDMLEVSFGFMIIITLFYSVLFVIMMIHLRKISTYDVAQKQYIDNVTHQLKSPVASIKALAQALSDGKTMAGLDNEFYYGKILTESDKLDRLIETILRLSKLQNNTDAFDRIRVSAQDVLRPVLEKYRGRCNLLGIRFEVSQNILDIDNFNTEPAQLQHLMDILLSNALKYADAENGLVQIDAETSKRKAVISITDNGIGIKKEELPHVFERFYRGSNVRTYSGSGLGLSMAGEIIDGLKEKIWIDSKEGVGTTVFFTVSI